jgi:hypothetical protein
MKEGILAFIAGTGVQLQGDDSPFEDAHDEVVKRAGDAPS